VTRTKSLRIGEREGDHFAFESLLEDRADRVANDRTEIVHRIRLSGRVHADTLELSHVIADFEVHPYGECVAGATRASDLDGLRLEHGYRRAVLELMGGTAGCTHVLSLALELTQLHTLVTFTLMRGDVPLADRADPAWMQAGLAIEPRLENACIALASESPVIVAARTADDAGLA
jgi:hypothetical protein